MTERDPCERCEELLQGYLDRELVQAEVDEAERHLNGCVYGAPHKRLDGRTHLDNLFLCGTDQGFLGIIGSMLSGITIANLHLLRPGPA